LCLYISWKTLKNEINIYIPIYKSNLFSQSQEATMLFNDGEFFEGYGAIKNNKIKF